MKTNLTIHHELIGTLPDVQCFRDMLDEIILRYEMSKPVKFPEFGLMSPTELDDYTKNMLKDPQVLARVTDGVVIAMCATHFYGLKETDFNSMAELIDAINSIEDELRNH